jgi:hydrogenase nickel incorporation protein HypA/HybF
MSTVHELSIAQSVLDAVCTRAAGRTVHSVRMRVGALTAVVPDAMRFCWALAAEGTVADGSRLDIDERPAAATCRNCGAAVTTTDRIMLCPCGSADLEITAGRELEIVSMEVG